MIDAHVHIFPRFAAWRPGRQGSPAEGAPGYPYQQLQAEMEACGVAAAVVLAGPVYGDWNDYVLEAMHRPDTKIVAAAAFFDPWADDAEEWYTRDIAPMPFKAVKLECSPAGGLSTIHPKADLCDEPVLQLCRRLEQAGRMLVLDLGKPGTISYQTRQVAVIADAHPDLRIVLCHMGQPGSHIEKDAALKRVWEEQVSLAKRDNIWLDFAALPCFMLDEALPVLKAADYLERVAEMVGVHKLIWGSDVPWLSRKAGYAQIVDTARKHVSGFTKTEQQMMLHENAKKLWME